MSLTGMVLLPWHDQPGLPSANSVPLSSLILCLMSPCVPHPLFTSCLCLLGWCLGAITYLEWPGLPPAQPSKLLLVLCDLSPCHLFWGALPVSRDLDTQSLLCPARAPGLATLMIPVTWHHCIFTCVCDKAVSF